MANNVRKEELKKRAVWFYLESYLQEWELQHGLNKASHWAYCYHDMDGNEPHYHIIVHYPTARSGNAVLRDFIGYSNTFIQVAVDPCGCYDYLTHEDDPNKYHYNKDRIVSHNPIYWEKLLKECADVENSNFLEDLLDEQDFNLIEMAKKYGRDFIKNYKTYIDFRYDALRGNKNYD